MKKKIALIELALISLFAAEADTFYYYAASHRLLLGQQMYRDFAFVQFPLLPYVYAPFFWLFGNSILVDQHYSLIPSGYAIVYQDHFTRIYKK